MPDRRGAAVLDDLPDDVVVDKILLLLPPKDVGRCRVVRKSWRSATSTPEFMVEHRRRQPSLPIIDGNGRLASFVILRGVKYSSAELWPFPTRPRCRKFCCEICLHAACDGFLIVSRGVRFYICNPTIRRQALLPFPRPQQYNPDTCVLDDSCIHGLYRHKSTGEYRVLWSRLALRHRDKAALYVLIVGDNESKRIEVIAPTFQLCYQLRRSPPAQSRGNLHWYLPTPNDIAGSTGDIIVFDTEAESFRWMSSPAERLLGVQGRVFDMEGTLACLNISPGGTAFELWLMQDYEAEIWVFRYRIDMSMIEASRPLDLYSLEEKKEKETTT